MKHVLKQETVQPTVEKVEATCDFCHEYKVCLRSLKERSVQTLRRIDSTEVFFAASGRPEPVFPFFGRLFYKIPDYTTERVFHTEDKNLPIVIDICLACAKEAVVLLKE